MVSTRARGPRWFVSLASVALVLLLGSAARAQLGSGWVPYSPPSTIHLDGSAGIESYPGTSTNLMNEGASFTDMGGIETFALHNPISNRSERRMQNTYLNGSRQFEGEVRVSPPTDDESVMQVFGGNSGATTQMIRAYNTGGGTLRKVPGSVVLAENIHGTWIKVNVIHDVGGNFVRTYINNKLLATGDGEATGAGNDGWYHKYGCYGTLRTGSAKVEWRNVKHFRDGKPPSGNDPSPPPPPRDGGTAPDATASDGGAAPDASATGGSGGSGGSAGSGGSSGSGGSGGSGGSSTTGGSGGSGSGGSSAGGSGGSSGGSSAGTGGRPPTAGRGGSSGGSTSTPAPTTDPAGCGCRLDPSPPAALPLFLVGLGVVAVSFRRRRR
jgi:MYXO-CTERM domain-containing protein